MYKKNYLLSDADIKRIFRGKVKIIKYSKIKYYNDLSELLEPYGRTVIIIESEPNKGHWTCLFEGSEKQNNKIFYFDSYGVKPDGQLKNIDPDMRVMLGEDHKDLIPLFHNYNIKYNIHQLQQRKEGIATCGRWCIARMFLNNLNSNQFAKLFMNKRKKPDDIITDATNYFLEK